jgi:hypothetical protein
MTTAARRWYTVSAVFAGCLAIWSLAIVVERARETARRAQCRNNLKQIGLALLNYHDTWACFPPPYIADEEGRPIHSWRVLIRPYLDASPFYNQYRFDEPWNGPNNSKLIASERQLWHHCPSEHHDDPFTTDYVAVVGRGTAWDVDRSVALGDMTDGPANTLLLVEVVGSGIHWAEPRDLTADQIAPMVNSKPGLGICSPHLGGAYGLMADGSVVFLSDKLAPATIRGLLTIDAGENVSP